MSDRASVRNWLDELDELVDDLAERINTHRNRLAKSESTTRYALIDPLLSKIGWKLADPSQVLTEYVTESGKRLDYAMWSDKRICLVVEAKALGKDLGDEEATQAIAYCYKTGCRHYVVTNGDSWEGYDLYANGDLDEKREFDFSVSRRRGIMDLFWLWPGNFESTTALPKLHRKSNDERNSAHDGPAPSHQSAASGVVGTPLPQVVYKNGLSAPSRLVFPDGTTKDVSKSWASIQPATVQWLLDTNQLRSLPLRNKRTGTYLVNETSKKKNGDEFLAPHQVREGIWIDMKFGPAAHLKKAQQILDACDVDPNTVKVSSDST